MSDKPHTIARRLRSEAVRLMRQGEARRARDLLERALTLEPGHAGALSNLGAARRALADLHGAIDCYRKALAIDDTALATRFNLANALKDAGHFEEATATYDQVLDIEPGNLLALNNRGIAYRQWGRHEFAEASFKRALEIEPGYGAALRNLATTYEDSGDFAGARQCVVEAFENDPDDARALAKIIASKAEEPLQSHLASAAELLGSETVSPEGRAQLHYGLGKYHDRAGDPRQALVHFRQANEIKARNRSSGSDGIAGQVDALCATFTQEFFAQFGKVGDPGRKPVFIVGMPRTGTTLAEQILSSHPRIAGGGELPYFGTIALDFRKKTGLDLPFPEGAALLEPGIVKELAASYLAILEAVAPDAERVTDKMPQNFFYLGLIALLFPSAAVIHCWRDPRDVCLSCFVEDFNAGHGFATDAGKFLAYFREYWRLMAHWRQVLPLQMFDLRYEDLVVDHENTCRTLLDAVGCAWDPQCLRFYEQQRNVATPSRWQVRQPIYSSSIGRWQRFTDYLAPVLTELSEFARAGRPGQQKTA
ncbi:MAG TPA: sulfotransferase [Woeseiaceae bacterium]|nr:sulfotransferase [Woeseiaceae bacterium]